MRRRKRIFFGKADSEELLKLDPNGGAGSCWIVGLDQEKDRKKRKEKKKKKRRGKKKKEEKEKKKKNASKTSIG